MKNYHLLLIFLLVGCTKPKPNLNGHWHIRAQNGERAFFDTEYVTIDIQDDSSAIFANNMFGVIRLKTIINSESKEMNFFCEGLNMKFDFEHNGNKLLLNHRSSEKYIGTICDESCCNKEQDYFSISDVQIQLPISTDSTNAISVKHSLLSVIEIGVPKLFNQKLYGNDYEVFMNSKYVGLYKNNFEIEKERHLIKIPESHNSKQGVAIYADQNTPVSLVKNVVDIIQTIGVERISYVVKSDEKDFKPFFKSIRKGELNQIKNVNLTWGEWVTKVN